MTAEVRHSGAKRLAFPAEEYARRRAALTAQARARDLDLVLLDEAEQLAYIVGFGVSASLYRAALIPPEAAPVYLLRALDAELAAERSWVERIVGFLDWEDPIEALAGLIREGGWQSGRIGLDLTSSVLSVARQRQLAALLPEATLVDIAGLLPDLRSIKSTAEQNRLRRAAGIADAAMAAIVDAATEAVSPREMARVAADVFLARGADSGRVGPVAIGSGEGFLHSDTTDEQIGTGDILHAELVPSVEGYSARLMRPTVIGPPSAAQAETAADLIALQDQQLAAMVPGAAARDVDGILRRGLLDGGLRETLPHITGYTLGFYHRATVRSSDFSFIFHPQADWRLAEGMAFHMYVAARGLAFSETVLVTAEGAERLTLTERRLFSSDP